MIRLKTLPPNTAAQFLTSLANNFQVDPKFNEFNILLQNDNPEQQLNSVDTMFRQYATEDDSIKPIQIRPLKQIKKFTPSIIYNFNYITINCIVGYFQ